MVSGDRAGSALSKKIAAIGKIRSEFVLMLRREAYARANASWGQRSWEAMCPGEERRLSAANIMTVRAIETVSQTSALAGGDT